MGQFRAFSILITKKSRPENSVVHNGTKLSKAWRKQFYSTMNETKAAFAERTIQSLKNILYQQEEEYSLQVQSQSVSIRHNN